MIIEHNSIWRRATRPILHNNLLLDHIVGPRHPRIDISIGEDKRSIARFNSSLSGCRLSDPSTTHLISLPLRIVSLGWQRSSKVTILLISCVLVHVHHIASLRRQGNPQPLLLLHQKLLQRQLYQLRMSKHRVIVGLDPTHILKGSLRVVGNDSALDLFFCQLPQFIAEVMIATVEVAPRDWRGIIGILHDSN